MLEFLVYLKLFGGFVYLLLGGDLLVRGSLGLAKKSAIPPMVVGLTVVAMGTSAPELMVSGYSAISGHPDIAVGNIIGSNIANILLVIGVPALIFPITFNQKGIGMQAGMMVAVTVLFVLLCIFEPFTFVDSVLLLFLLVVFLGLTMRGTSIVPGLEEEVEEEMERVLGVPNITWKIVLYLILGIVTLPLGANLVVEGATGIARSWGVSEAIIGLSLIAIGTSLPELSTTVVSALHKSSDVAVGNVIGSNLLNILAIMGVTSMLADVPVDPNVMVWDIWVMLGCSLIVLVYALGRRSVGPVAGVLFIGLYVVYLASLYHP